MKNEERGSEPLLFQKVLCVFLANEQPGETAEKYVLKTFFPLQMGLFPKLKSCIKMPLPLTSIYKGIEINYKTTPEGKVVLK